jgi:hypothetical protein
VARKDGQIRREGRSDAQIGGPRTGKHLLTSRLIDPKAT